MVVVRITENVKIGDGNPCFIIAEAGQNHQGSLDIAKELIKAAKKSGADCIKFQKSCLKEKFTEQYLKKQYDSSNSWGPTYGEHKQHLEFSDKQFTELSKYAREVGILFTASASDMVSFDFLLRLDVPFVKIGSGDSNNLLLLKYATYFRAPLVLSTGMVNKATVDQVYNMMYPDHDQFCLLHCVSAYPAPFEDCNLSVIQDYKKSYNVPIGYSSHELGTSVAVAAVAMGAKIIEKHITLDKNMKGTDHVCSLTPPEFRRLVDEVRTVEAAIGSPIKKVVPSEIACIDKLQKSLVMGCLKKKGDIIYPGDVNIKVADPKGMAAVRYSEVVYKYLLCDKNVDEPLNEEDFCY